MSTSTESMLLSLLSADSAPPFTTHGLCIKKSIIWQTILALFLRSEILKNTNIPGRPRTPLGELTRRAYISLLPQTYSWWRGDSLSQGPSPNNHTPVLGTSIRPHLRVLASNPVYSAGNRRPTCDYYRLVLIHNNAYSYLLVLHS